MIANGHHNSFFPFSFGPALSGSLGLTGLGFDGSLRINEFLIRLQKLILSPISQTRIIKCYCFFLMANKTKSLKVVLFAVHPLDEIIPVSFEAANLYYVIDFHFIDVEKPAFTLSALPLEFVFGVALFGCSNEDFLSSPSKTLRPTGPLDCPLTQYIYNEINSFLGHGKIMLTPKSNV